jgi:hypothetical protein
MNNQYWFTYEPMPKWVRELQQRKILDGPFKTSIMYIYNFYVNASFIPLYEGDGLVKTSEGIITPIFDRWVEEAKDQGNFIPSVLDVDSIMEEIYTKLGNNQ